MKEQNEKGKSIYISINIIIAVIFVVLEILGLTIFNDNFDNSLLCRVMSRGTLGLIIIYNSLYLLITSKWSFICLKSSKKQRIFCGVVLGLVGAGLLITALLGYGTNGDPRLIWWK